MPISKIQIYATAEQSKLALSADEVTRLANELYDLLDYAEVLADLRLDTIPPMTGVHNLVHGVCRQHIQGLKQTDVLALAPESFRGFIRVPRVIDND